MKSTSLAQMDFNFWAQQTASLLRQKRFDEIDIETLAQEVEDLGKSERRAIASYLTVLLTHLLKWKYQPASRQYTDAGEPRNWVEGFSTRLSVCDRANFRRPLVARSRSRIIY